MPKVDDVSPSTARSALKMLARHGVVFDVNEYKANERTFFTWRDKHDVETNATAAQAVYFARGYRIGYAMGSSR